MLAGIRELRLRHVGPQDHRPLDHSSLQTTGLSTTLVVVLPTTVCAPHTSIVLTHTLRNELEEEGRTEQARTIQDNSVGRGPVCVMANLSSHY